MERQLLAGTPLAEDVKIEVLAENTPSLSGSDLKELCRNAALKGLRDSMTALHTSGANLSSLHAEVSSLLPLQVGRRGATRY
jgi:SpoVK/Ycf46/Vps4 family AAA+-type ATPase